jgi:hypothetical protein
MRALRIVRRASGARAESNDRFGVVVAPLRESASVQPVS